MALGHERPGGDGPFPPDGCEALGHLASPFVDGEVSGDERDAFAAHLDTCAPCQALVGEIRAIDLVARPRMPAISEERWQAAQAAISRTLEGDRVAAAASPVGRILGGAGRFGEAKAPRGLRLLLQVAAAAAVFALVTLVIREAGGPRAGQPGGVARRGPEGAPAGATRDDRSAEVLSIACASVDDMPVVFTTDGEDAMTVVQCVHLDTGT